MTELSKDFITLHDAFDDCLSDSEKFALPWRVSLTREAEDNTLGLRFLAESVSASEKRYLESVEQRVRLAELAGRNIQGARLTFNYDIDRSHAELECHYTDGEPIMEFVPRQNHLESGNAIKLLLDLVAQLKLYVDYPRILSNIRLQDFVVFAEAGIRLRTRLRIASAVLKTESPMSDFRLWEFWRDEFTQFASTSFLFSNNESKRDRKHPLVSLSRKLGALFKSFEKQSELSLPQKFEQLESLLQNGLQSFEEKSVGRTLKILTEFEFPRTTITKLIRKEYSKVTTEGSYEISTSQSRESFSGFVSVGQSQSSQTVADTVMYFTTPGDWFGDSVIETINRKMTTPFLKVHHNGIRIRSMTCETAYTCLISDHEFGIPLPSLMMARSGIDPIEALAILHKIHRAMAQFETADFPLELRSPWQIQLHFDASEESSKWQTAIAGEIEKWPAWDIRIRAETPPEHYLSRCEWHSILERLSSKFFPALTAWMLDWKRFTWVDEHSGDFDNEPFNWESKMDMLIKTAGTHLNEKDAPQRQKFLQLVEEVISPV